MCLSTIASAKVEDPTPKVARIQTFYLLLVTCYCFYAIIHTPAPMVPIPPSTKLPPSREATVDRQDRRPDPTVCPTPNVYLFFYDGTGDCGYI